MSTPPSSPPVLSYAPKRASRWNRRILIRIGGAIVLIVALMLSVRAALPWMNKLMMRRSVRQHMSSIEAKLQAQSGQAASAASLNAIGSDFAYLAADANALAAGQRTPGRRTLPIGIAPIIAAAQMKDPAGATYNVLVTHYVDSVVATVWPVGLADASAITQATAYLLQVSPSNAVTAGPALAPLPDLRTLPIDLLVDGQPARGRISLKAGGIVTGDTDGWHVPGSLIFTPGRFGCRNVEVSVPPATATPHEPADAIHFMSDNRRLIFATPHALDILDLSDSTHHVVSLGRNPSDYVARYCFSRDGAEYFYPWHHGKSVRIDVLSGAIVSSWPQQETFAGFPGPFGFDEGHGVYGFGRAVISHFDADGHRTILAVRFTDTLRIVPNPTRSDYDALNGCSEFAVSPQRMAIGYSALANGSRRALNTGIFLFDRTSTGWSASRRASDWDGEGLSLSPDGQWLAAVGGRAASIFNAATALCVFRGPADLVDRRVDAASWSDDGRRALILINGSPVLVLPAGTGNSKQNKTLAIRFATLSSTFGGPVARCAAISPDGRHVVLLDSKSKQLLTWNTDALIDAARNSVATAPSIGKQ